MNRFLRSVLVLFVAACSVPNFGIAPEEDAGLVDGCATQIANGKPCGGLCAVCEVGQACESAADCATSVCEGSVCAPAATCSDEKVNGVETDTDCGGGSCPACNVTQRCTRSSDCASTLCDTGVCVPAASCSDQVPNGAETDTDCGGGSCPACTLGARCTRANDCKSGLCDAGMCAPMPTCTDKAINGIETDTDCGGGTCPTCALDAHCTRASDCASGLCKAGICATPSADPTCNDTAKNATETDIDCGGTCDPCAVDKRCAVPADCVTLVCATVCQPASCKDNVRNGNESDKDCGGSCIGCGVGLVCKSGPDCQSLSCSTGHCIASTCSDKIKNAIETGIDCGGGICGACPASQGCSKASDCVSLVCAVNKTCSAPTCNDGVKNGSEANTDCGMGCAGCQKGAFCNTAADCASATCTQKFCVPSSPSGGNLNPANWVASASISANDSPPSYAIDGSLGWRWATGTTQTTGMWFALDMKATQFVFSIDLNTQASTQDSPALFDVYTSIDGTYPALPTLKSVVGNAITHIDFGKATPFRYVKFVITSPKNAWWSIQELTVAD